ncbi:uncharacterized protein LOC130375321 isoform X1 [Gadus chalcogrammus]|uniref:uncharacterized protein LOC130375321 isoform X1 n=1 Tax=Gadus chalcogrammus TaxID=1042646 RepID=UPI0024C4DD7A|nr:uncharacterized protein LOC130375321 isoform X1 [Gadus chalcogrammus]
MSFGINLGSLLVFLLQAEHVNSLWVPHVPPNVGPSPWGRDETRLGGYPQNQFRQDAIAPSPPWSPSIHSQAGVNSALRQELSRRRNYPVAVTPRSAESKHNSVVLRPRTLQLSAFPTPRSNPPRSNPPSAQHRSRQDKRGGDFVLSDAIASGSAIRNGKSSSAGSVRDSIDRKAPAVTKRLMDTPRRPTGELLLSPKDRFAAAVTPTTLSSSNSGLRAVAPIRTGVNVSPQLSAAAAASARPEKPRRAGAKVAGHMVRRRPSFRSSKNYRLPELVKAYGKSAPGTELSNSELSVHQRAGPDRNAPPRSFLTGGKRTANVYAPTKVQTIPIRFGGIPIQRLRDPLKNGGTGVVSRPQATYSAPLQKTVFYSQRANYLPNQR